jgi:hypothetical protein
MTFIYSSNIPASGNTPANDQPLMQANTNYFANSYNKDHNFTGTSNPLPNADGFHTVIHQVVQSADPASIAGTGQLYAKNVTVGAITDTQLFYKTGLGGVSQLTGTSASSNGYQWIGGVLIQWGQVTGLSGSWPTTTQTLNYAAPNIQFNTNTFNVQTTFIGPTSSSTGDIAIVSLNKAFFQWVFTASSSASYGGFYWVAIGS